MIPYLKQPAIYIFTNKTNNKIYVGGTMNMRDRMYEYNNHRCRRPFDRALTEFGLNGFHLEINYLPNFDEVSLLDLEEETIKRFNSLVSGNGYNICLRGKDRSGTKHTDESIKKMSDAKKGNTHGLGYRHTPEAIKKISDAQTKKPVLQFSKNYEFIAEFASACDAEKHNIARQNKIGQCCNGKRKSAGGYIWEFKQ